MHAVVLSFDHLHLAYLGCYGNDWIETPHLDALAAQSVVFDQHFGAHIGDDAAASSWWSGRLHAAAGEPSDASRFTAALRAAGVASRLLIEESGDLDEADAEVAPDFDEVIPVRGDDEIDVTEVRAPFASLVNRARRVLDDWAATPPAASLLWLKSRGVPLPWLPPHGFGELYLEEFGLAQAADEELEDAELDVEDRYEEDVEFDDDGSHAGSEWGDGIEELPFESDAEDDPSNHYSLPEPVPARAEEPVLPVAVESAASTELKYARAMYAGYVTYLDRWIGKMLAMLDDSPLRENLLLIVVAGAGSSLGERGAVGEVADALHEELVHTPLIVRQTGVDVAGSRRAALVQTIDMAPTLLDWFGIESPAEWVEGRSLLPVVRQDADAVRDAVLVQVPQAGQYAIRTQDFLYIQSSREHQSWDGDLGELYQKPEDRWERANVYRQFPQIAEELDARLLKAWPR